MTKVAKARKSTHKATKATGKSRGKVLREEPDKEYDVAEIGPIYLLWGKKRVKNDRGKTVKKYYIRKTNKHLIWVKWVKEYSDKHPNPKNKNKLEPVFWSAEPQERLRESGLGNDVDQILAKKIIWPFPSKPTDGELDEDSEGWLERQAIAKEQGYKPWVDKKTKKTATWNLLNAVEASTASSDASSTEASEAESSNIEEEEEEDEV